MVNITVYSSNRMPVFLSGGTSLFFEEFPMTSTTLKGGCRNKINRFPTVAALPLPTTMSSVHLQGLAAFDGTNGFPYLHYRRRVLHFYRYSKWSHNLYRLRFLLLGSGDRFSIKFRVPCSLLSEQ